MESNYLQKEKTYFHITFSHYTFSQTCSKSSYFHINEFVPQSPKTW